jgi:hypothetical protein
MTLIELTGQYAVGPHRYAIVDDDMYAYLSQWKWKAKPNGSGNNVYAVRNRLTDGKSVTVRMHRVVAGLDRDNPMDVDHWNHNSLDNRRGNLRPATRSVNLKNARRVRRYGECQHCGVELERIVHASAMRPMSCASCKDARRKSAHLRPAPHSTVHFTHCRECSASFAARLRSAVYCSDRCRYAWRDALRRQQHAEARRGPISARQAHKNKKVLLEECQSAGNAATRVL